MSPLQCRMEQRISSKLRMPCLVYNCWALVSASLSTSSTWPRRLISPRIVVRAVRRQSIAWISPFWLYYYIWWWWQKRLLEFRQLLAQKDSILKAFTSSTKEEILSPRLPYSGFCWQMWALMNWTLTLSSEDINPLAHNCTITYRLLLQ